MDGIIIFKSKYGSTSQYAEWISQLCHIPATNVSCAPRDLNRFDYFVIGSSVYVGKLLMKKWLQAHQQILANKKLFFFIVGGTPEEETKQIEKMITDNIPVSLRPNAEIFYLPGGLDIAELTLRDKLLLRMGAQLTKNPQQIHRMLTGYDDVKFSHLRGIIRSICHYSGQSMNPEPAGICHGERLT
jgi:menaquinone-dependent protoporphyrinogen IX oxidase